MFDTTVRRFRLRLAHAWAALVGAHAVLVDRPEPWDRDHTTDRAPVTRRPLERL